MGQSVEHRETGQLEHAMSVESVMAQIKAIQQLMSQAMKEGEHYGVIPGTSRKDKDGNEMSKPSLLKPGAEKIGMMFRLAPSYEITETVFAGGHIGYRVTCTLTHIRTGETWGQGVGSCSTLETKYRFRNQKTDTGSPIPDGYKANKGHYRAQGFVAAKDDAGQWIWAKLERVEHDNPADYYNTALKIAKKRAQVDATLTATAASDFFTQDLEDMAENGLIQGGAEHSPGKVNEEKANPPAAPTKPMRQQPPPPEPPPAEEDPFRDDPPPSREPGQDDEEPEGEKDYRAEVFMSLKNMHKGNQVAMSDHLKALTTYTRKDGTKAQGKTSVDKLTDGEAKVTYHKLTGK